MPIGTTSVRSKITLALAFSSLLAIGLMGIGAHALLKQRFNDIAMERAFTKFSGDVTRFIARHGSWEAGVERQGFRHFIHEQRPPRHAGAEGRPPPPRNHRFALFY